MDGAAGYPVLRALYWSFFVSEGLAQGFVEEPAKGRFRIG